MKFTIGFSPCPNDTFIFDALVNKKIDTGDLEFEVVLEDVETLNKNALAGTLDFTKLSYGVLPLILGKYILLNSGSALGTGVGPLLIAQDDIDILENNCQVAVPGEYTTAHLLFGLAFPNVTNKIYLRYDEIENFVLSSGKNKAGVIIHENRFTYEDKGLKKILDLGEYWQKETGSAIPLGGIVAKRSLSPKTIHKVDELIKKSIEYSYKNYPELSSFVKENAQEMEESIMRKHIDLYVNKYSTDLGIEGKKSVKTLLDVFDKLHPFKDSALNSSYTPLNIFFSQNHDPLLVQDK